MKTKTIKWRDSNIFITQCDIDDEFNVAEITSIWFVIQEDDKKIVLAWDIIDWQVRRVIAIPKENIIK